MHNCEEFRERLTEQILDREEIAAKPEFQHQFLICSSCADFYAQSLEMMEVLDGIDLSIPESQWNGIEHRLRAGILNVAAKPKVRPRFHLRPVAITPFMLAAAALLVITMGLSRLAIPRIDSQTAAEAAK